MLLADLVMAGINGHELATAVLALRPKTRVLFVSGHDDSLFAVQSPARGNCDFLAKPFTVEGLAKKVRAVLNGKG